MGVFQQPALVEAEFPHLAVERASGDVEAPRGLGDIPLAFAQCALHRLLEGMVERGQVVARRLEQDLGHARTRGIHGCCRCNWYGASFGQSRRKQRAVIPFCRFSDASN